MDQDMEADEFFPDKMLSEPDAVDEGRTVPTSLDDVVNQAEGGDSVVNGEAGAEEMETDEPPSVQGEEMETVDEDAGEAVADLEDLVKGTETEDSSIQDTAGQIGDEAPSSITDTDFTQGNVGSADVTEDSWKQDLSENEADVENENDIDNNQDLEAENLNEGVNNATENDIEEVNKNSNDNDVLNLEEPLRVEEPPGETDETEKVSEDYGIITQDENSTDKNYKENTEDFEVGEDFTVTNEITKGGNSESVESVIEQEASIERTEADTPESETSKSEATEFELADEVEKEDEIIQNAPTENFSPEDAGIEKEDANEDELLGQTNKENKGTAEEQEQVEIEEREPVETEEKEQEEIEEREPVETEKQDEICLDHGVEETSGILEENSDVTGLKSLENLVDTRDLGHAQTESDVIEDEKETEEIEDVESKPEGDFIEDVEETDIIEGAESESETDVIETVEETEKSQDVKSVPEEEEAETDLTETSQNIGENINDETEESQELNTIEDFGAGGAMDITEDKDESNIDEEKEDEAKEGLESTTDDKEEEMDVVENITENVEENPEMAEDVESGVVESMDSISADVEEESDKAEETVTDKLKEKTAIESDEQKQREQTSEETSKAVADDENSKPPTETDSTEMSERDSGTVSQTSSTPGEKSSAADSEEIPDEISEAVSQSEVQPSGDSSNQSEAVSQSEATPSGDNSNQSDETSDKKSAEFDISNVKIKKERMDSTESDKTNENDSTFAGSSQMKIVGVTSAVGVEDKADNSDQVTAKGDNADQKRLENNSTVNDEVKVKQEATAAGKDEVKKKLNEELKKKIKHESKPKEDEDDDVIAIKEERKPVQKPKPSKIQTCIVCGKVGKCKYNIVRNGDVKHLCDDNCFKRFRSSPTTYLKQAENAAQSQTKPDNQTNSKPVPAVVKTITPVKSTSNQQPSFQTQSQVYKTCTVCQLMNVRTSKPFLNWQGLDFCGEECLGKYQGGLSNNCSYCSGAIFPNNKAKYCCRVGSDVKHFCSANCNNDYVKRMKLCAFCNLDLAHSKDSFMAPVGDTFKDFCSQDCLQKFEDKNNKDLEIVGVQKGQKATTVPKGNFVCAVCGKVGPVKHEFKLDSKVNRLCSDPCFSAFQYANKLTLNTCDNCGTNLNSENQAPQYVQFEGQQRRFCSFMCVNSFRNTNKKTVPCAWCGNKKSNFDMIERVDANNKYQLFCSLNCLSLYRVNLQATSNKAVTCDQCRKFMPAQYHLTMSDASVRNFCSYGCVMQFQAQFQTPAKQMQQNSATTTVAVARGQTTPQQQTQQQQTTTRSGRVVTKAAKVAETQQQQVGKGRGAKKDADSFPIISNVVSLAPQGTQHGQQQINIKSSTPVTVTNQQQGIKTTTTGNQTVQQQIIIQPPPPKVMKNKHLLCKPFTQTKATSCRPHTQIKEVQTDGKAEPEKCLVPIPVPLYCPTPLAMYCMPTPILVPVPIPIPVPVFIPTTKKNAISILKQIKEIREKIPADPLEAELLMMAEAVAEKEDESSSSSEEEDNTSSAPPAKESSTAGAAANSSGGELGEDMLQMALRMASEMTDEPVMDLENSLEPVAVNTEPPPAPKPVVPPPPEPVEDEDEYIPTRARRSRGSTGNKRQSRNTPRRNPKRQKVEITPPYREVTPSPPAPAAPPPDANFHLKYTYGVNAFKHWVIQKNSQLEQASKPGQGKNLRTFKSDILQCTADELNFSLCLFVKEVRKPNGEEYAVDSIYYLCLGIQQYLFENGRIDNIFTDFYYERFTEQLNEILTRYEPKLNHAGQLVCRIEEEHLWESKQLGAHSPHVLLNSLVYFNTKYFMLKTSEDHLKLSFTHIMKHWKKTATGRGSGTGPNAGRSVYLRYYCPTPQGKDNQKKKKEEMPVYEQTENLDNPLRCPVKLYEFYLSKCPESIKNRNDMFYLKPESSSVPDSPVWYSNQSISIEHLTKLLNRIRLVREIQEAHLHTQPIYI